jgi:GNAT superfamily N-acetyltransferase
MSGNICIAAGEHPSLTSDLGPFVAELAAEQRYFGPTGRCTPKASRALITNLAAPGGFRVLAMADQHVVGAVRVDEDGELFVAVLATHRGLGIGYCLAEAAIARATRLGHRSIVLRTTRRARAALRLGERLDGTVFDTGRGAIEVVVDLSTAPLTT